MELTGGAAAKRSRDGGEFISGSGGDVLPWRQHPSSRIYRVSRASGGKDRHSKVLTAKGIRDRRVRLSVSTAIQFYDLQDRLGFDQPSKAIEWLIKAAAAAIDKLPALDGVPFGADVVEPDGAAAASAGQMLTNSGCSSTSDTSKGSSVLSLSRSNPRVHPQPEHLTANAEESVEEGRTAAPSEATFTELLTGAAVVADNVSAIRDRQGWPLSGDAGGAAAGDYLGQASIFMQPSKPVGSTMTLAPYGCSFSAGSSGEQPDMINFSSMQDNLSFPIAAPAAASEHNLNFSISSGLAGANRGTLQSNSHPLYSTGHQQLQRLPLVQLDGSGFPFFGATSAPAENQFSLFSFDGRPQLWDGLRHPYANGKGKR